MVVGDIEGRLRRGVRERESQVRRLAEQAGATPARSKMRCI